MRSTQRVLRRLLGVLLLAGLFLTPAAVPGALAAGNSYYIDCSSGTNGNGSMSSPWNTLVSANTFTFSSDTLFLKRGTTCWGKLAPKGSGTSATPNKIDAYGTGSRPIINAGDDEAAIKLYNQEYWTIQNVETVGGNPYGIWVRGDGGAGVVWRGFNVTNVVVRNVRGESEPWGGGGPGKGKNSGGIVFKTEQQDTIFDGITIDNATVYSTQRWAGILIEPAWLSNPTSNTYRARNVIVRNSTVYDTYGEGILVSGVSNALIENNVAYDTGKAPASFASSIGTPNGIWTYSCNNCTVQFNEAYLTHSPGIDGGAFDADYYSDNVTYQYNYGHDADGYCVSAFGAESYVTTNIVIRYNVCSNNGREAGTNGAAQGDFYFRTWNNGGLSGVQVYNNTSYWNPASNEPAVKNPSDTAFSGQSNFFRNNIIYSTSSKMVESNTGLSLNNNLYWYTGGGSPSWLYNGTTYTSFSAYQSGSGQDAQGKFQDPLLNNPTSHSTGKPTTAFTLQSGSPAINAGTNVGNMGNRDFFGNTIPQGGSYDIGAFESSSSGSPPPSNLLTNPSFETGSLASGWGNGYGTATVVQSNAQSGQYAMKLPATGNGSNGAVQIVSNLQSNTQYTLTFYAKTGNSGQPVYVGVEQFNSQGTVLSQNSSASSYGSQPISITFTTGSSNTSAKIWIWRANSGSDAYVDNLSLTKN